MYQVAGWVAQGVRQGFDNYNTSRKQSEQQMNSGMNGQNNMITGQAPATDTQNAGYFTKTMTDIAMPGMSSEIETNSPIASFMQAEKQFASPMATNAVGATARPQTVAEIKQAMQGMPSDSLDSQRNNLLAQFRRRGY